MKTKFCIVSILLLMPLVFFSCDSDSKEVEIEEPEQKNHYLVDDTNIPIEGLLFSYNKNSSEKSASNSQESNLLDIYLYGSQPHIVDHGNQNFEILKDSAPMIHFKLYTSANGKPDIGDYLWKQNSTTAGHCVSAWHGTKQLENRILDGNVLVHTYEKADIRVANIKIKKVDDLVYEIIFDAIDNNGAIVSGYFKGRIGMTQISYQD